ncbi:hypothetical protein [Legionella worsleiensis]|uniref:Uncharacterized protein n=1 Tax=Legionella worsleiensis TaxID=45076 RepID=A0A0W1AIV2_9GAMM|nr:hypothetical protein [Legionella worsleiensis]KTD81160.1 hypothetical protein Lwor_0838 [Legionella worsleiensis]STY33135.1 Uncharacterised protein [Legionella worsleiensis]
MKIKSTLVGLIIAASMVIAAGPLQAECINPEPGWHMVSKHCNFKNADNWQEYASGIYLQPVPGAFLK